MCRSLSVPIRWEYWSRAKMKKLDNGPHQVGRGVFREADEWSLPIGTSPAVGYSHKWATNHRGGTNGQHTTNRSTALGICNERRIFFSSSKTINLAAWQRLHARYHYLKAKIRSSKKTFPQETCSRLGQHRSLNPNWEPSSWNSSAELSPLKAARCWPDGCPPHQPQIWPLS